MSMMDDLSGLSVAIVIVCSVATAMVICRVCSRARRPESQSVLSRGEKSDQPIGSATSEKCCVECKPKPHSTSEAVAIQTAGVRDYPIWNSFAGTYFAFNPPWMLEIQRRNSSERDDRRRYRQYLATHVRRYLELPRVETAHYVFTAGGLCSNSCGVRVGS